MPSKTISLKDVTYERLRREKSEDESFSDVVDRLLGTTDGEHPLYELIGLCEADDLERLRTRSTDFRESVSDRMERRS
jgi:predicted CopG family antitoxin